MSEELNAIIWEDTDNCTQYRLTVSFFNGREYLHIRKYYLDFSDEFLPTKEGISFPLTVELAINLFKATSALLSSAETKEIIEEYFKETIIDEYNRTVPKIS